MEERSKNFASEVITTSGPKKRVDIDRQKEIMGWGHGIWRTQDRGNQD